MLLARSPHFSSLGESSTIFPLEKEVEDWSSSSSPASFYYVISLLKASPSLSGGHEGFEASLNLFLLRDPPLQSPPDGEWGKGPHHFRPSHLTALAPHLSILHPPLSLSPWLCLDRDQLSFHSGLLLSLMCLVQQLVGLEASCPMRSLYLSLSFRVEINIQGPEPIFQETRGMKRSGPN